MNDKKKEIQKKELFILKQTGIRKTTKPKIDNFAQSTLKFLKESIDIHTPHSCHPHFSNS